MFRRTHYARRPWIHEILERTSQPEQAFENWMQRDADFARWLEAQVAAQELAWLSVDRRLTGA